MTTQRRAFQAKYKDSKVQTGHIRETERRPVCQKWNEQGWDSLELVHPKSYGKVLEGPKQEGIMFWLLFLKIMAAAR